MSKLEYLKEFYGLQGKSVHWAIIEEKRASEKAFNYKPGLYIKGSKVYVDLNSRRFYSIISLSLLERKVYVAQLKVCKRQGIATLIAMDDKDKSIVLPHSFVEDTHNNCRYAKWMEDNVLL